MQVCGILGLKADPAAGLAGKSHHHRRDASAMVTELLECVNAPYILWDGKTGSIEHSLSDVGLSLHGLILF